MMFLIKSLSLLALYTYFGSVVVASDDDSRPAFRLLWDGPTKSGKDNVFRSRVVAKDATNRVVSTRIVGGSNAPPGRYPYYTYIEVNTLTDVFSCSASLIWEDILLTSAHCILDLIEAGLNITGTSAWVGLENQSDAGFAASEARQVALAVPHPEYVSQTQQNDIMIMKLGQPVLTIEPVMYNTLTPTVPVDGQRVDVFGFGLTASDATTFPNDLQTVDIQVIPFNDCNDANSYNGLIFDDVMICAGVEGGGKDACAGDSGSPLIVPGTDANSDLIVGLVSFGDGCALPDKPGVYTRVSSFTRFIFNQLCNFSENPPSECDTTPFNSPAMSPNMVPEPTPAPLPVTAPLPTIAPVPSPTMMPVLATSNPIVIPTLAPVPLPVPLPTQAPFSAPTVPAPVPSPVPHPSKMPTTMGMMSMGSMNVATSVPVRVPSHSPTLSPIKYYSSMAMSSKSGGKGMMGMGRSIGILPRGSTTTAPETTSSIPINSTVSQP